MVLDPSTPVGKLRLRVADFQDLPFLPDSVYDSVLAENDNNIPRSAKTIAMYILGMLSQRTHRRLSSLEVWGAEAFKNYKEFLLLTFNNPAFMDLAPIPYFGGENETHPLIKFQNDWNKQYVYGTQSEQLSIDAVGSSLQGLAL